MHVIIECFYDTSMKAMKHDDWWLSYFFCLPNYSCMNSPAKTLAKIECYFRIRNTFHFVLEKTSSYYLLKQLQLQITHGSWIHEKVIFIMINSFPYEGSMAVSQSFAKFWWSYLDLVLTLSFYALIKIVVTWIGSMKKYWVRIGSKRCERLSQCQKYPKPGRRKNLLLLLA